MTRWLRLTQWVGALALLLAPRWGAAAEASPRPAAFVWEPNERMLYATFGFRDAVTDTLRALMLRAAGYKVDVVEFVAPEHTPRNVMLRAVSGAPCDPSAAREYVDLTEFWGITPYLERALGDALPL